MVKVSWSYLFVGCPCLVRAGCSPFVSSSPGFHPPVGSIYYNISVVTNKIRNIIRHSILLSVMLILFPSHVVVPYVCLKVDIWLCNC